MSENADAATENEGRPSADDKRPGDKRPGDKRPGDKRPASAALIFDDPLDQQSSDDTDRGWGERPTTPTSAADLARFLDEKPPHHI